MVQYRLIITIIKNNQHIKKLISKIKFRGRKNQKVTLDHPVSKG